MKHFRLYLKGLWQELQYLAISLNLSLYKHDPHAGSSIVNYGFERADSLIWKYTISTPYVQFSYSTAFVLAELVLKVAWACCTEHEGLTNESWPRCMPDCSYTGSSGSHWKVIRLERVSGVRFCHSINQAPIPDLKSSFEYGFKFVEIFYF